MQDPFSPTGPEMEEILGRSISNLEMDTCRSLLAGIRRRLNFSDNNGLTHCSHCWAFGPAHYECAVNKIVELLPMETLNEPK